MTVTRDASGPENAGSDLDDARVAALTGLESEFGELITHFRRTISENASRLNPGMLPGAYKTFTTIVRHETVTASVLAEALMMDKGQLSRTLRELEDIGLIERAPDTADRRATLISPTAEGVTRLAAARRPREGALHHALASWTLDDIRTLTDLLHRLTESARTH